MMKAAWARGLLQERKNTVKGKGVQGSEGDAVMMLGDDEMWLNKKLFVRRAAMAREEGAFFHGAGGRRAGQRAETALCKREEDAGEIKGR